MKQLLTMKEVADRLRVTEISVRRWTKAGLLRAVQVGPKLLRYREEDIDTFARPEGGQRGGTAQAS